MNIPKNVVVTGGAGFIGFNFVKLALKKTNWTILVVDSLTYAADSSAIKELKSMSSRVTLLKCDINDLTSENIEKFNIDTIINFAAESHVDNSILNPDVFIKSNINGVINILKLVKEHKLRFHQVSTDEVYGELPLDNKNIKFSIDSKIEPSSPYSASKGSADLLIQSFVRTYGIKATISRCSNNFGPYQQKEKLIPKIITNLIEHKKVPIYGDGLHVRDWIYVEDHNYAVLKIMETTDVGIFNIGATNEKNNLEIATQICEQFKLTPSEWIEFVKDRPGHDRRYAIDWESMKKIGWKPKFDFAKALLLTIDFFKNKNEKTLQ